MHRAAVFAGLLAPGLLHAQWTTSRIQGSPEPPKPYIAERVFAGIPLSNALEMVAIPGADRFCVVERDGKIWSFPDSPDASEKDLMIDLKPDHPEMKFAYGVVFHPKWRENNQVFITYNYLEKVPDGTKLSRFTLTQQNPPVLDPESEVVLLTWLSGGHNGACLRFGPDGMLYISTGDADVPSPPDWRNTGQDLGDFLSSILRIDVDRPDPGKAYGIPADNPFVGMPGVLPENWAFGFRNPWKFSFDEKGRLWCGDVGWELWEMIHLVQRGGNHGWSAFEASNPIKPETQRPEPVIPPVAAHPHTEAASMTGGFEYRGSRFPELQGAYVYGDYETGKIWALWHDGQQVTRHEEIADTPHKIVTFGQSEDGELYWIDWLEDSPIYRLAPNPAVGQPSAFPRKLSETGLFSDTAGQVPERGVHPFEVAEPMWQDGAAASRYVALPNGGKIAVTVTGQAPKLNYKVDWPVDAVLARTVTWPPTGRRLETQVLHFDGETWNGYSYRWNESGTDAELVPTEGAEFAIKHLPEAEQPAQPWRIHSRAECSRCHTNWSGFAIGFQPDQLTRIAGRPAVDAAAELNLADPGFFDRLSHRLVSSRDADADVELRARSWLSANCAHCHRRNGGGSVPLVLNADLPTADCVLLDEKPQRGELGLTEARVIAPGHPERSVLLSRIARYDPAHMPMIGAREVDPKAFELLWEWISGLGPESPPASLPAAPETAEDALRFVHAIGRGEIHLDPAWLDSPNRDVAAILERFRPIDQRIATLGTGFDPKKLLATPGDADRGAALMSLTGKLGICLACHTVNGAGRRFGPDLSQVGARLTREQLVESLHQPSKTITKGFETWHVILKDGSQQAGLIADPGAADITLTLPTGQTRVIGRPEIRSQKMEPVSLMPEGLLSFLTAQEATDLIEYLAGLK